jgi:ADP-heptose:LPS heptosyltransferase
MISFTHAGKLGDILYSLYFCKELSASFQYDKFNYNLLINKKPSDFCKDVSGEIMLSRKSAEFIKPLLENLPFIQDVTIVEKSSRAENNVDLNLFRSGAINQFGCEIREWYYTFCKRTLPQEFWMPLISAKPNPKYKDKILFTLTERNVNVMVDYKQLEQFREHLTFIGTVREHCAFQEKYFDLERAELTKEDNLLTVAQYLAGAKGYMANQSGFFALAELMKINRILLSPEWVEYEDGRVKYGPKNNLPLGGWCNTVSITRKMVDAVRELLEK